MSRKPARSDAPERLTLGGAETPDERSIARLLSELPSPAADSRDDRAVERVWRRVIAPPAPSSFSVPWWAPAAVVALVMCVVLARPFSGPIRGSSKEVELALSSGGVFSSHGATGWRASRGGDRVAESDRLRTDTSGRMLLRIPGVEAVAAVLVGAASEVGLERVGSSTSLRLSQGTLTARVSKRPAGDAFVVETEHYSVTVVGTLFTVEQGPGDHTAVSVREGVVLVSDRQGYTARVVAGERWTSESREQRTKDRTPDTVKALLEGGLAGRPATDLTGAFEASKTADVSPPPPAASSAPRSPPSWVDVPGWSPAPGSGASLSRGSAAESNGNATSSGRGGGRAWEPVAPVDGAPAVAAPEPSANLPSIVPSSAAALPDPAPSASSALAPAADEGPYARGLLLERKGDFAAAASELDRAAEIDPEHADIALYTLGRLAQRRLHDPGRARAAFNRYRARYPHGALLPEVDLAIVESEIDAHAQADALADSARFLRDHPSSERTEEVHLLRGNLLRDGDDCREALGEYARVHADPFVDHAVYSTAYCQKRLGHRLGAAATLRDYLTRFPNGAHRTEAQRALSENSF